jgi:glycine cleavage system aminomethyltransferase T
MAARLASGEGSASTSRLILLRRRTTTFSISRSRQQQQVELLLELGKLAGIRLVGRQAQEILRVEAGRPLMGTDMDETHFPSEVGLDEAVDPAKTSYVGATALIHRLRSGAVASAGWWGFRAPFR